MSLKKALRNARKQVNYGIGMPSEEHFRQAILEKAKPYLEAERVRVIPLEPQSRPLIAGE